ncbi:luciferase [Dictyobacter alpinus]|uniref:Luciferase n=1 Tax=Dictyobacter alpinus TaxID=2014873 RepID=A0A402BK32_9CHLR|nr:LLM class flavin-dependent oxidoreductase [Dictyobacter alpinus]GCE31711.1 luciferase [Dictyobacter alpinus]
MQIGVGLPSTVPGVQGALILDWARRADNGPFSSLGVLDRLVFTNYEPLVTLSAAAAVTQRIRLMTTILIAPLHSASILAKQSASIDALSNGRLTLGLAVGAREDDFKAAQVSYHDRGKIFDEQLATMKRIWEGQPVASDIGPVGPAPAHAGGPEILIGGNTPVALQRVGRWGNGYIVGGGGPAMAHKGYQLAEKAWQDAGRSGKPRFVACMYYGLGANAAEQAGAYIRNYYSFMPQIAESVVSSLPTTPEAVKAAIQAFEAIGLDELIIWPCIAESDQLDRLADVIGTLA